MSLTQEQIDFFAQNGFLNYGQVLDDSEVDLLRNEYESEFEKAWQENSLRNLSASGTDAQTQQAASQKMLQIEQMCERNIHFRRLLYNERILDLVQDLIGPNIQLFHDQGLWKPAHTGGPVPWHQDNAYWHCRPATLISCWLTLDDVNRENGAMQVIPGSHLTPAWHDPDALRDGLLAIEDPADVEKAIVVDLPAGGCMFHHCQTLHYTQPNTTERQRRAFAMHYMQPGTSVILDGQRHALHADFSHPVLRMRI